MERCATLFSSNDLGGMSSSKIVNCLCMGLSANIRHPQPSKNNDSRNGSETTVFVSKSDAISGVKKCQWVTLCLVKVAQAPPQGLESKTCDLQDSYRLGHGQALA